MTTIRTAAIAAYDAACAMPAAADWRSIADMLRSALAGRSAAATGFPAWWADYALPKHYTADSVDVLFHDGETVRANVFQAAKKPARIAATIRTAIAFYRARTGLEAVPPIASVTRVSDGATFDAAACSEFTVALRSKDGARIEAQGARAVTSHSIARMEAELERRRGGLARLLADVETARGETVPLCLSPDAYTRAGRDLKARIDRAADAPAWHVAIAAGEDELSRMRAAYGEAESVPMPAAAETAPLDADDVAAVLALAYPEPVEADLSGTFEAGALIFAATIVSPDLNVHPVEAIQAPAPVEAIATAPTLDMPTCAKTQTDPDACLAEWRPTAESHPIVALCLSPAAADALFDRVLDGTFRAAGRTAKGGAWRLTVEDARACADIPSLRLVGMPRKPYPRRAAPPVEAIPVVEIRTVLPVTPSHMIAGAAPRPIVYHSPA